ncbi:MAG: hypothetical protein Q7S45_02665 [Candidatus Curtissbacteria bacterium]|nr:hypothetical protein [Candidatus Curtissbacteria bacterium]
MDINDQHKKELERKILEQIIDGLEDNKLTSDELPTIAGFVLSGLENVMTHEQVMKFLTDLSSKWPIFQNLALLEKGEVQEAHEDKIEEQVLNLAKSGNVEEAISLAKTVTKS